MTEVFVNDVGWVDLPETLPGPPLRCGEEWTEKDYAAIAYLLPHYSVERIAWMLGRTVRAVRTVMDHLEVDRPHIDQPGRADTLGRVA